MGSKLFYVQIATILYANFPIENKYICPVKIGERVFPPRNPKQEALEVWLGPRGATIAFSPVRFRAPPATVQPGAGSRSALRAPFLALDPCPCLLSATELHTGLRSDCYESTGAGGGISLKFNWQMGKHR